MIRGSTILVWRLDSCNSYAVCRVTDTTTSIKTRFVWLLGVSACVPSIEPTVFRFSFGMQKSLWPAISPSHLLRRRTRNFITINKHTWLFFFKIVSRAFTLNCNKHVACEIKSIQTRNFSVYSFYVTPIFYSFSQLTEGRKLRSIN